MITILVQNQPFLKIELMICDYDHPQPTSRPKSRDGDYDDDHSKLKTKNIHVSGKEDEDGYPSQELVIYGSSRSSPRSHSAVGGNFDPQVDTISIIASSSFSFFIPFKS